LGDRIAVMKGGELQQAGEPMAIYERPANLFVAGFIGSPPMNFFRGVIARNGKGICFAGEGAADFKLPVAEEMAAHEGKRVVLGIRAEHITEQRESRGVVSGPTVEVVVELAELMGAETHLHATCGGGLLIARVPGSGAFKAGGKVSLAFDTERAHFFDAATENVML